MPAGNALWIIGAMLAQMGLALALLAYLGTIRLPMIARREVRIADIALSREGWPEREHKVSNAFDNQLQLPVLFYVSCLVAISFGATMLEVVLAVTFVATRFVHAAIHITSNHVIRRFWAYAAGFFMLVTLWGDLVVRMVAQAAGAA